MIRRRLDCLETQRDLEVLDELIAAVSLNDTGWVTPIWIGGTDSSHHSATLAKLVKNGLAERKVRGGYSRPSYLYRPTRLGRQIRKVKKERRRF